MSDHAMSGMSPRVKKLLADHLRSRLVIAHQYRRAMHCENPAVVILDLTDVGAFEVAETLAQHSTDNLLITHGKGWVRAERAAQAGSELHRQRAAGTPIAMAISAEMAYDLTLCADPIAPGTFLAVVVAEGGCWNRVIPLCELPLPKSTL